MNEMFADGGVVKVNPSPVGGTWAYRVLADGIVQCEQSGITTPGMAQMLTISNNLTEMLAVVRGLQSLPIDWQGTIYSDSQITLGRIFLGWKWHNIPAWLALEFRNERARLVNFSQIQHVLLDGHPTKAQLAAGLGHGGHPVNINNVWCDSACGKAALSFTV